MLCGAAVGVTADMNERIEALLNVAVDVVCIDTAHGHSLGVLKAIKKAKQTFKHLDIIGGNVATEAGAKALINAGVDGVKVGRPRFYLYYADSGRCRRSASNGYL